ncbi:MAG: c-type cytochrome, partial [Chloroflexota bacterium]|nr:c-type cytochrome [Chloroflexota bacterium]
TANELHIPTGKPVYLTLCAVGFGYGDPVPSAGGPPAPSACQGSTDQPPPAAIGASVIHSFWVPELAGTQDVIPNQTNHLTIQADEPGVYEGQCKEYCGLSHAYMAVKVVAHTPEDFERWVAEQQTPAAPPEAGSEAAAGLEVFTSPLPTGGSCTDCHAVAGLEGASGQPLLANGGPNLTHLMSRQCFRGCTEATTPENLRAWIDDPRAFEAGSFMPDYGLSSEQLDQVVAYLTTLE